MPTDVMGFDPNLWDNSLLGPQIFGDPGSNLIFSPSVNGADTTGASAFPWLSNAPDGSVFSAGDSTPTVDFLNSMPSTDASTSLGYDLSKFFSGFPSFGGMNLAGGFSNILGGPSGGSVIPGLMALGYASAQPNLDTGPLNAVLGQLGGSSDAIVRAATDPLQANIAGGYGDLLQSQAARGIRGSSFGDNDIANYLATTGRSLADAGASASAGSLSLQGNLAAQIAALKNQGQQIKNNLYGTAFDVLGRGLNPKGYTNSINVGGTPMVAGAPGATGNPLGALGGLVGGGLGLALGGPVGGALGLGLGGSAGSLLGSLGL